MEQCLQVLSGTAMSAQEKLTLLAVIDDFVFPRLAEAFGEGRVCAMPNRFRLSLEALLASAAKRTIGPATRRQRIAKNSVPWGSFDGGNYLYLS